MVALVHARRAFLTLLITLLVAPWSQLWHHDCLVNRNAIEIIMFDDAIDSGRVAYDLFLDGEATVEESETQTPSDSDIEMVVRFFKISILSHIRRMNTRGFCGSLVFPPSTRIAEWIFYQYSGTIYVVHLISGWWEKARLSRYPNILECGGCTYYDVRGTVLCDPAGTSPGTSFSTHRDWHIFRNRHLAVDYATNSSTCAGRVRFVDLWDRKSQMTMLQ